MRAPQFNRGKGRTSVQTLALAMRPPQREKPPLEPRKGRERRLSRNDTRWYAWGSGHFNGGNPIDNPVGRSRVKWGMQSPPKNGNLQACCKGRLNYARMMTPIKNNKLACPSSPVMMYGPWLRLTRYDPYVKM